MVFLVEACHSNESVFSTVRLKMTKIYRESMEKQTKYKTTNFFLATCAFLHLGEKISDDFRVNIKPSHVMTLFLGYVVCD